METKEMLSKEKVLKNKQIRVEPIIRPKSFFKKGHDGEFMYTGCKRIYTLPFNSGKRSFFNPFLQDGEQEFFEKALNQKEGALNLYDAHSKFWGTFTISLDKNGMDLDLNNPSDALRYRVMLVDPKFANGEEQRDVPECEYILIDEEIKEKAISEKGLIKDKAMDYMYKLKKSKKAMYDTLRLLGRKPDSEASIDWFKNELYNILDEPGILPGTVGIKQFIATMEDPIADVKIFVLDAIEKGEIVQGNDGYRIADGRKYIGKDINHVYNYFADGTPEAKEEKIIIEQRLKN